MNWYGILQSVITFALTSFAVAVFTWATKTSKRITKLEEHELMIKDDITELKATDLRSISKLDEMIRNQERMNTKLDLLLEGRINIKAKEE